MNAPLSDDEMQLVKRFYQSARAYCDFIDSLAQGRPPKLYEPLIRLLLSLCQNAIDLPLTGSGGKKNYDKLDLPKEQRATVSRMIDGVTRDARRSLMQRYDAIEGSFEEDKTRAFMLFDDLADVYSDVMDGIRRFELGKEDAIQDALWDWRHNFEWHWGEHLHQALQTLHEIRYQIYED